MQNTQTFTLASKVPCWLIKTNRKGKGLGNDWASPGVLGFSSTDSVRAANSRPLENLICKSVSKCFWNFHCSKMYVSVPTNIGSLMLTLLLILMLKWNHMEKSRSPDFMVVLLAQAQASTTAQVLWPKVAPFCFASSICFTKCYWKLHMFLLQRTLGWMGMHAKLIEKAPGFSSLHEWCALGEDLAPCRPWQKALIAMSSAMEWRCENMGIALCDVFELVCLSQHDYIMILMIRGIAGEPEIKIIQ